MEQKENGNLSYIFPGGFRADVPVLPTEAPELAFQHAMEDDGLQPDGVIEADGRLHRVRDSEDDKHEKTGWYIFFLDGIPAGAYGTWRREGYRTWCAKAAHELTPAEAEHNRQRIEAARRQREEEQQRRHDEAAARALETWNAAPAADPHHAYLTTKRVQCYGLKQLPDGRLLVPMYNEQGAVRSYQAIAPDGTKRYLAGGEKKGCFFLIGEPSSVIYVCEGYSTTGSVHEASGHAAAAAFDCGNLLEVGQALRRLYPFARLIFCADNDQWKPENGNPGVTFATAAARAIPNSTVVVPQFRDTSTKPTDFNDLALLEGQEAVRRQVIADAQALEAKPASIWADRELKERQWIWHGWIPVGQTTALYGDGGVGKTLLAQQLLTACATGVEFISQSVTPGRALGIFCEDDEDELHRRQHGINKISGISFYDLKKLYLVSRVGMDNLLMTFDGKDAGVLTGFWHQLNELVAQLQPSIIVIDTAADTFGGNENIRPQVRQYVQGALTRIAQAHQCAIVLCAHPSAAGLQSGEGTGGSTAWSNSVRSRLYLSRDPETDRTTLTRKKSNYAKSGEQIDLVYNDGAFITHINAKESNLPTTERAIEHDFIMILRELNERDTKVSDAPNGGRFAPKVICKILKQRGNKHWTQQQLEGAMERLFMSKKIQLEHDLRKETRWLVVTPEERKNV